MAILETSSRRVLDLRAAPIRPDRLADTADRALAAAILVELPPGGDDAGRVARQLIELEELDRSLRPVPTQGRLQQAEALAPRRDQDRLPRIESIADERHGAGDELRDDRHDSLGVLSMRGVSESRKDHGAGSVRHAARDRVHLSLGAVLVV